MDEHIHVIQFGKVEIDDFTLFPVVEVEKKRGCKVFPVNGDLKTVYVVILTDDSGQFVGIDLDIVAAVGEEQGLMYEVAVLGWDASIAAFQAGQLAKGANQTAEGAAAYAAYQAALLVTQAQNEATAKENQAKRAAAAAMLK